MHGGRATCTDPDRAAAARARLDGLTRVSPPAVRYGRVPKRPREPVATDSVPEPVQVAAPSSAPDDMDPSSSASMEAMRLDMAKELVKMVTAAHRSNNTYTEEIKSTLQQRTIVLRVEDSDTEGKCGYHLLYCVVSLFVTGFFRDSSSFKV